jgi:hypothetical protein
MLCNNRAACAGRKCKELGETERAVGAWLYNGKAERRGPCPSTGSRVTALPAFQQRRMRVISLRLIEQMAFATAERQGGHNKWLATLYHFAAWVARGCAPVLHLPSSATLSNPARPKCCVAGLSACRYIYCQAPRLRRATSKKKLAVLLKAPCLIAPLRLPNINASTKVLLKLMCVAPASFLSLHLPLPQAVLAVATRESSSSIWTD